MNPRLALAVVLLLLVALLAAFGGPNSAIDRAVIDWLGEVRSDSPSLTGGAIFLTWLGSVWATLGAGAAGASWLALRGNRTRAAWLVILVGGGRLVADGLKLGLARPRPQFADWPVPVHSLSFPSGHAANTMLAFTALAIALPDRRWRGPALFAAVLLSILIGLTRPLLGVHWPSDVLGGWALGGAIVLAAAPRLMR